MTPSKLALITTFPVKPGHFEAGASNRLDERCAPCFLADDQVFLSGRELKEDLAKLDAHYAKLPAEVRERGVMTFAHHPPVEGDFLVTRLWDRFLPGWREKLVGRPPRTPEQDVKLLEYLNQLARARSAGGPEVQIDQDNADFVRFERHVPIHMGKWRFLPPEVENADGPGRGGPTSATRGP